MRLRLPSRFVACLSLAGALLAAPEVARAGDMDIVPERLVLQPPGLPAGQTCQSIAANPELAIRAGIPPENLACRVDDPAFRNLVGELGFALAPTVMHPARTTGMAGFVIALEGSFTSLNTGSTSPVSNGTQTFQTPYWQVGTQGRRDPATKSFVPRNDTPSGTLQVWALKARKGLPFGLELATVLGVVSGMTGALVGGDVRWAVLEGFRTGVLGYVPDVSVGAGVRNLAGASKLYLTTASFDAVLSKPIALADASRLSPYVGYQRVWVFGNSTIVDLTPNTDALVRCGYKGSDPVTGAPLCSNKLSNGKDDAYDFANNNTFTPVRVARNRGVIGVQYEYELVHVGAQVLADLTEPSAEGNGLSGGRQWTLSLEAGVTF